MKADKDTDDNALSSFVIVLGEKMSASTLVPLVCFGLAFVLSGGHLAWWAWALVGVLLAIAAQEESAKKT